METPEKMSRKMLIIIPVCVVAFLSVLLACALVQAFEARADCNAFLSDIRNLRVGESTYDDVVRIHATYRNRSSVEGNTCERNLCILDFSFENIWLYHSGLVPGARFVGSLTIRNGVLVKVNLTLSSNPGYDATTTEETSDNLNVKAYEVGGRKFQSDQRYSYVWAHITSAASEEQRRAAYAFNLACLTRFGGCKDANEILPILLPR